MKMIKLINEISDVYSQYTAIRNIEITISEEASLDEMLDAYAQFLRACGYTFDGRLEVVDDE